MTISQTLSLVYVKVVRAACKIRKNPSIFCCSQIVEGPAIFQRGNAEMLKRGIQESGNLKKGNSEMT